jgi:osmotically-inducible protein OsmY
MPPEREIGERAREDYELEQDVRAELEGGQVGAGQGAIRVAVRDGVVYLTGVADSYARKWAAERAAGRVAGVKDVRDYLDVDPIEGGRCDDPQIEQAASSALAWDARVPGGVGASVVDGVVRLHGAVDRSGQREAAEEAVRNLIGVRDIVNEIRLAPVRVPDDLAGQVDAALRRRFGADAGGIAIATAGGVVTLSGLVSTFAVLDDVERAVRSLPGVTRVDARLLVS